jgi:hypothetical protein
MRFCPIGRRASSGTNGRGPIPRIVKIIIENDIVNNFEERYHTGNDQWTTRTAKA